MKIVATFALLTTILGCLSQRADALPYAVALVITAGYWFTSSTSFANPAVTIARSLTHSFSGIRPQDVPAFIAAQIVGAVVSTIFSRWLWIVNDQQIAAPANRIGVFSAIASQSESRSGPLSRDNYPTNRSIN